MFYCTYEGDEQATAAMQHLRSGKLPIRVVADGTIVPPDAVFLQTAEGALFARHHLRRIRTNGEDQRGHLDCRNFKIPGTVTAANVIALRPIPDGESILQRQRRGRGLIEALAQVHFSLTGECICGHRPQRKKSSSAPKASRPKSGHHAKKRRDAILDSPGCGFVRSPAPVPVPA